MRKPAWVREREAELADAGVSSEELKAIQAEYERAGLNLSRVPQRGWRVYGIHPTAATTFIMWTCLASLVGNRAEIVNQFREMSA